MMQQYSRAALFKGNTVAPWVFFLQLWHVIAKIKFRVIIYQYDLTDAVVLFMLLLIFEAQQYYHSFFKLQFESHQD